MTRQGPPLETHYEPLEPLVHFKGTQKEGTIEVRSGACPFVALRRYLLKM